MMRWLIDGYNVIRRDPDLRAREGESLEAGRTALLRELARVAAQVSDVFTVVFDGARTSGGGPGSGRVQVMFSRPPETADDVLRRLACTLREGAVVVTSDRVVQTSARRAGAVAVAAEVFLAATRGTCEDPDDPDEDEDRPPRGGPSHRLSREARAAQRVLRRLRPR
jgi:predicted RNA-binding protein with PIN domain